MESGIQTKVRPLDTMESEEFKVESNENLEKVLTIYHALYDVKYTVSDITDSYIRRAIRRVQPLSPSEIFAFSQKIETPNGKEIDLFRSCFFMELVLAAYEHSYNGFILEGRNTDYLLAKFNAKPDLRLNLKVFGYVGLEFGKVSKHCDFIVDDCKTGAGNYMEHSSLEILGNVNGHIACDVRKSHVKVHGKVGQSSFRGSGDSFFNILERNTFSDLYCTGCSFFAHHEDTYHNLISVLYPSNIIYLLDGNTLVSKSEGKAKICSK